MVDMEKDGFMFDLADFITTLVHSQCIDTDLGTHHASMTIHKQNPIRLGEQSLGRIFYS